MREPTNSFLFTEKLVALFVYCLHKSTAKIQANVNKSGASASNLDESVLFAILCAAETQKLFKI